MLYLSALKRFAFCCAVVLPVTLQPDLKVVEWCMPYSCQMPRDIHRYLEKNTFYMIAVRSAKPLQLCAAFLEFTSIRYQA